MAAAQRTSDASAAAGGGSRKSGSGQLYYDEERAADAAAELLKNGEADAGSQPAPSRLNKLLLLLGAAMFLAVVLWWHRPSSPLPPPQQQPSTGSALPPTGASVAPVFASPSCEWALRAPISIKQRTAPLKKADAPPCNPDLGTVVLLAAPRHQVGFSHQRFCLLRQAITSAAKYLIQEHGCAYPIHIVLATEDEPDYTEEDRALLKADAAQYGAEVIFEVLNMLTRDALEPFTTPEQVNSWAEDGADGAVKGRNLGYRSMCRLWSGRLQAMDFMQKYKYYLRMDDDSYFTAPLPFDPFRRMEQTGLHYAWKRDASDSWGIDHLWKVARPLVDAPGRKASYLRCHWSKDGYKQYNGGQPYNNFHVASMAMWQRAEVQSLYHQCDVTHCWLKFRVGDANYHGVAIMLLANEEVERWESLPYVHNSNDEGGYPVEKHMLASCRS